MKHYLYSVCLFFLALVATSCSDAEYLNAIPYRSSVLVSIDIRKMSGLNNAALLKTFLHVKNWDDSGIDLTSKLYLFQTSDGTLGLCARIDDRDRLLKGFEKLSRSGLCTAPESYRGFSFLMLNDAWAVGVSDAALLVVGPVTALGQDEARALMVRCFKQKKSIVDMPLFQRVDSMQTPVALVGRVNALPEKLISPFVMGIAPADREQACFSAGMTIKKKCLYADAGVFSFTPSVDRRLKSVQRVYRPLEGKYAATMSAADDMGIFLNVQGTQYLPLLQKDRQMQALLAGLNTVLDMDNILKSVDGELAVVLPSYSEDDARLSLRAVLGNSRWLQDVPYWKASCPSGSSISDCGSHFYCYRHGRSAFYFGVSADSQFYSGDTSEAALASIRASRHPLPADVQAAMKGRRMALVVNLSDDVSDAAPSLRYLKSVLGQVRRVVICM